MIKNRIGTEGRNCDSGPLQSVKNNTETKTRNKNIKVLTYMLGMHAKCWAYIDFGPTLTLAKTLSHYSDILPEESRQVQHLRCIEKRTFLNIPCVSRTQLVTTTIHGTKSSGVSTDVSFTCLFKNPHKENPRKTGLVIMMTMRLVHCDQSIRQEK